MIDKKGKKPIEHEEPDFKQINKNKTKKIAKNEKTKGENKLKLEESSKSNEQSSDTENFIFHETNSKKRRNRRKKRRNKVLHGKILK